MSFLHLNFFPEMDEEEGLPLPNDVIQLSQHSMQGLNNWPIYSTAEVLEKIRNLPEDSCHDFDRVSIPPPTVK